MFGVNTFTDSTYFRMWCKHIKEVAAGDDCRCIGKRCPSLVITMADEEQWVGYCGIDHPNCMVGREK